MPLKYTFRLKNLRGNLANCFDCGGKPDGVVTDKSSGCEYWNCNACFDKKKFKRCSKRSLHIDFRKSLKKSQIHTGKNEKQRVLE